MNKQIIEQANARAPPHPDLRTALSLPTHLIALHLPVDATHSHSRLKHIRHRVPGTVVTSLLRLLSLVNLHTPSPSSRPCPQIHNYKSHSKCYTRTSLPAPAPHNYPQS